MFSWYLWCFWNPSIPFYSLPPSVFHPASFATCFAAVRARSPFSWAKLADLRCHLAWSSGCIQADTFSEGDSPGWATLFWSALCLCGWMPVTWERLQSLSNCSCGFHTGEIPWSLRPRHLFQWQNCSRCSLLVVQAGKPLALYPSSGTHEMQTSLLRMSTFVESHSADFYHFRNLEQTANAPFLRMYSI